jgi:hypothetical protein
VTAIAASSISAPGAITLGLPVSSNCTITTVRQDSRLTNSRGSQLYGAKARGPLASERWWGRVKRKADIDRRRTKLLALRRHPALKGGQAIARAFRWWEMLENGTHATIAEIAAAEKISESYVGRVLRLTLLAPISSRRS